MPDYITHVQENGFYGWPWWYIGAHQDPRHSGKHPELKDKAIVPDVLLQPHNASLQIAFYSGKQFPAEYQGDIFAAQHGSWNNTARAVTNSSACLFIRWHVQRLIRRFSDRLCTR